jgi:hypothetical protein
MVNDQSIALRDHRSYSQPERLVVLARAQGAGSSIGEFKYVQRTEPSLRDFTRLYFHRCARQNPENLDGAA